MLTARQREEIKRLPDFLPLPCLQCVGGTRLHRKDYQYDAQKQSFVHRSGTFTIASNSILPASITYTVLEEHSEI